VFNTRKQETETKHSELKEVINTKQSLLNEIKAKSKLTSSDFK